MPLYTTGLPTPKFADLLIRLREEGVEGYPPSLGVEGLWPVINKVTSP